MKLNWMMKMYLRHSLVETLNVPIVSIQFITTVMQLLTSTIWTCLHQAKDLSIVLVAIPRAAHLVSPNKLNHPSDLEMFKSLSKKTHQHLSANRFKLKTKLLWCNMGAFRCQWYSKLHKVVWSCNLTKFWMVCQSTSHKCLAAWMEYSRRLLTNQLILLTPSSNRFRLRRPWTWTWICIWCNNLCQFKLQFFLRIQKRRSTSKPKLRWNKINWI